MAPSGSSSSESDMGTASTLAGFSETALLAVARGESSCGTAAGTVFNEVGADDELFESQRQDQYTVSRT